MNIKFLIDLYTKKLERKQRIIEEYLEEKNSIEGFNSSKREVEYNVLYAEINLLSDFIYNLKNINEGEYENEL